MKVYVAGRTTDFERVREVQQMVREHGHEITFDWTRAISDDLWKTGETAAGVSDDFMRECAENDRRGTREADVIIMLSGKNLCGTLIEVGMALAMSKRVWIIGKPERDSVFFRLPEVSFLNRTFELHAALARDWPPIEPEEFE